MGLHRYFGLSLYLALRRFVFSVTEGIFDLSGLVGRAHSMGGLWWPLEALELLVVLHSCKP